MNEFEIIQRYFQQSTEQYDHKVIVGIGDDAAVINPPQDKRLVLCMDTLVSGVHFPSDTSAEDIAYKSLAVNLSDMAAMGATPHWITLSLTTPEFKSAWYEQFAESIHNLANEYSLKLVGGDLSRGPLSVTIQLQGLISMSKCLLRSGAKAGDDIYVSGELGAAAYALNSIMEPEKWKTATSKELLRLNRPSARIELGQRLLSRATSCIDISDGLYADLNHILKASHVGAELQIENIPLSLSLQNLKEQAAYELAITGGDDYELCFTLPENISAEFLKELNALCPISKIGKIDNGNRLVFKHKDNSEMIFSQNGYKHF